MTDIDNFLRFESLLVWTHPWRVLLTRLLFSCKSGGFASSNHGLLRLLITLLRHGASIAIFDFARSGRLELLLGGGDLIVRKH